MISVICSVCGELMYLEVCNNNTWTCGNEDCVEYNISYDITDL